MDENQELRQEEINLMDLIFYCLEKWRWIVVFMIILAVAAGAYKYRGTVKDNQAKKEEALALAEAQKEDNNSEDKDVNKVKADMQAVEYYEQNIAENTASFEKQREYLDTSAVMEMDPYHVSTGMLSYHLNGGDHTDSLIAAFGAFVSDGRLAEKLHEANSKISVEDLRYLMSFTNTFDPLYKVGSQGIGAESPENAVFQIKIRMPDESTCKAYLRAANEAVGAYSARLQSELGEHGLTLLASTQSEIVDADIKAYQDNTRSACLTALKNVQTLRTELDTLLATVEIPEQPDESGAIAVELASPRSAAVKYAFVGLVLGAFLVCFVLMIVYMMGGKLRSTDNFHARYGMPLVGVVQDSGKKKKAFGFIDDLVIRMREGSFASIGSEEQIKMAASNVQAIIANRSSDRAMQKIMLAGTMAEAEVSSLCTQLAAELPGIVLSPYKQIVYQSSALKDLEHYDGILFLEKKGSSNSSMILQERKSASDRNVAILGAIVLY